MNFWQCDLTLGYLKSYVKVVASNRLLSPNLVILKGVIAYESIVIDNCLISFILSHTNFLSFSLIAEMKIINCQTFAQMVLKEKTHTDSQSYT